MLGGRDLVVRRPRDSEALIDEHAFEHEEFLPYWAELWPSGVALARRVAVRALHGARTLELGCGLGLPSLAAALAGGRVVATDWSPQAIELLRANAEANDLALEVERADWAEPGALLERAPWDLVLGADLLYERRNAELLLPLLPRLLGATVGAVARRPGAPAGGPVPGGGRARRSRSSRPGDALLPQGGVHRLRKTGSDPARLGRGGDLQRAGGDAAGAAQPVRDAAVEEQRIALLERVDLAVEVDLEAAARHVEQDVAGGHHRAPRASGGCRRSTRAPRSAPRTACARRPGAVLSSWCSYIAEVAAHERGAPAARGGAPEQPHGDAEGAGDPLHGADARPRQPALELAQERVGEPGLAAEILQRPSAFLAQGAHAGAERRRCLVGLVKHDFPEYREPVRGLHAPLTAG